MAVRDMIAPDPSVVYIFRVPQAAPGRAISSIVAAVVVIVVLPVILLLPALRPGRVLSSADLLLDSYLMDDVRPPGFAPGNTLIGDPMLQFGPWQDFAAAELRQGHLPLWNPRAELGEPFLGNGQSALFDPLGLPRVLGGGSRLAVITALVRLLVAGLGTFLFAKRLGVSDAASALAGVAFGCSGFMVVWLLFPHSSSAAWFPWAMVAAESMRRRRSLGWAVGLGVFLGLSALGGHLEVAFWAAVACSVYVLLRGVRATQQAAQPSRLAVVGRLAVAGAVALVVSAPAVLPFVENLSQGSVMAERSPQPRPPLSLKGFRWDRAALLAYPYAYGRPVRGEGAILGSRGNFCENNDGYASLLALMLAVVGMAAAKRGSAGRTLGILGAGALVLLTSFPPVVWLLRMVPVVGLAVPERAVFVLPFCVAVLAAIGADVLAAEAQPGRFRALARLLAVVLLAAAGAAIALGLWFLLDPAGVGGVVALAADRGRGILLGAASRAVEFRGDALRLAPVFAAHYLLPWGGLSFASGLLFAGRGRIGGRKWVWIAVAVVVADLYWFGHGFNPAIRSEEHFPVTNQVRRLKSVAGGLRVLVLDQKLGNPANLGTEYGWRGILGYDVVGRRRVEAVLGVRGPFPRGPTSFPLLHYDRTDPMVLNMLSVGAVASRLPLTNSGLLPAGRLGSGFLYRNPDALPEVSLPARCVVVADEKEALDVLSREGFNPAREAVVEASPGAVFGAAHGTLRLERPTANQLRVTGTLERPGVVVINEGFDPGWRATEHEERVAIFPCDVALMAVRLGAGPHDLVLEFVPRTWPLVAGMWLAGLVGAGAVAFRRWRRGRTGWAGPSAKRARLSGAVPHGRADTSGRAGPLE